MKKHWLIVIYRQPNESNDEFEVARLVAMLESGELSPAQVMDSIDELQLATSELYEENSLVFRSSVLFPNDALLEKLASLDEWSSGDLKLWVLSHTKHS